MSAPTTPPPLESLQLRSGAIVRSVPKSVGMGVSEGGQGGAEAGDRRQRLVVGLIGSGLSSGSGLSFDLGDRHARVGEGRFDLLPERRCLRQQKGRLSLRRV